jgi:hypothetical protein
MALMGEVHQLQYVMDAVDAGFALQVVEPRKVV